MGLKSGMIFKRLTVFLKSGMILMILVCRPRVWHDLYDFGM